MITPLLLALVLSAPPPRLLDAPPASLPHATRYQLANGLRVVLVPNLAVPWLDVRLAFRIGSASDPDGKGGLASMVGSMLTSGVPGLDEQAFAEALARLGATIGSDVDAKTFTLSGQVTTLDPGAAPRFLELFRAAALEATLPEAVLTRQKKLRIAGIEDLQNEPEQLADMAVRAFVLAGRAEGRPTFGTTTSTSALTQADLVAWRDRALIPAHAVLVIGGAFDEPALLAWLNDKFGQWTTTTECNVTKSTLPGQCSALCRDGQCLDNPTATLRFTPASAGPQPSVILLAVDDPTMTQVQWRYGQIDPVVLTNPDWAAFRLATQVLGGEFTARLNNILRTREGMTYGAYLSPELGAWESNVMSIQTDASPAALTRSITIGVGEYRRIARELVPTRELEDMRNTLVNGFPFRFETVSDVVGQYLFVELADMPYSWLAGYTDAIARVDAEQLRAAFQGAIAAHPQWLVVVGPATLENALAGLNMGPVLVVPASTFLAQGR